MIYRDTPARAYVPAPPAGWWRRNVVAWWRRVPQRLRAARFRRAYVEMLRATYERDDWTLWAQIRHRLFAYGWLPAGRRARERGMRMVRLPEGQRRFRTFEGSR